MIPIQLSISGFLSYRKPVTIDFTSFELACIAGANGAGKSSLLDAITWALFGIARKRDDSVITIGCDIARVSLVFGYEGNIYRVMRVKPRSKTAMLEFHILQASPGSFGGSPDNVGVNSASFSDTVIQSQKYRDTLNRLESDSWKPLTERTMSETQRLIQSTLRMDYDTFVNASFFLQGKADLFTQQNPGDRKRILGSILGLEVWESYRQRASEQRRSIEVEINRLEGNLSEIVAELGEGEARKKQLATLEADLVRLSQQRQAQEASLADMRTLVGLIEQQQQQVTQLARQLDEDLQRLNELEKRYQSRCLEQEQHQAIIAAAPEIEVAYQAWKVARAELERWQEIADHFREQEKQREAPLAEIQKERARLEQEISTLQKQQVDVARAMQDASELKVQLDQILTERTLAEARLERRRRLEDALQTTRERITELEAENKRLRPQMNDIKERIDRLSVPEDSDIDALAALCPLCGQPLSPAERQRLLHMLQEQGSEMGDQFRANQALIKEAEFQIGEYESQILSLAQVDSELLGFSQSQGQIISRLEVLDALQSSWQADGVPRLTHIESLLKNEGYAPDARLQLAQIDAGLKEIGYDAAEHDQARQRELQGRSSEGRMQTLEVARATLQPLEREISEISKEITAQKSLVERRRQAYQQASEMFSDAQARMPDLRAGERALIELQEQENRLRMEVGAAQQKVLVLEDLEERRVALEAQRQELATRVGHYKKLERAFGKDGVPALLIEQALPQIESKANEILDRLSAGNMSVRFITQTAYKDKSRDDLRETLDIQISDSAGQRDYEMFSGGEAFRVNFAIRLALSEVLAQRAGARLQTLVIDEGFGSQDAQGRQRLIEAINMVSPDFAKILVITHIDELKDAFPTRIEVEKTDQGSFVQVI